MVKVLQDRSPQSSPSQPQPRHSLISPPSDLRLEPPLEYHRDIACDVQASVICAMFGQCFLLMAKSGDFEQVFKGSIVLVGIKLLSIQKGTTSHRPILEKSYISFF
jgi:hypothetical protein